MDGDKLKETVFELRVKDLFVFAFFLSLVWHVPKYLVIMIYEAIRNF